MRLKQKQGSVLVLVLGILAVSTILLSALIQLIEVANRQTAISRDMVRYRTVLDSLLDYSIYGIKQRWCFSALMLSEPCTWNHLASAERLIMSDNVSRSLGEIVADNPAFPATPPFRIPNININLPIANITNVHPLFRAIQPAQSAVFTSIDFQMWRVTNVFVPQHGEEAVVGIRVTLNSTTSLFRGLTALTATSTVIVFPRQLNQFALIVPRDLRMDLASTASANGDANFFRFGARSASGTGLVFESPVFVNRNVHVPITSASADPPYSPVTFAQRVVIGDGRLFDGGALMSPTTPGGQASRTYDQISGIGGFLRGIEIDEGSDRGLEVFTGQIAPPPPVDTNLSECRDYLASKSDLTITKASPLYVQQGTAPFGAAASVTYKLTLGGNNAFNPQRQRANIITRSFAPGAPAPPENGGWRVAPDTSDNNAAVGYVYASFGALSLNFIQARISMDGEISATFIDPVPPRNHPTIRIALRPVVAFGLPQPNQAQLVVSVDAGGDYSAIPSPIRIYFKAYDYGTHNAADRRKSDVAIDSFDSNFLRESNFQFIPVVGVGLQPVPYNSPLTGNDSHQVLHAEPCAGVLPVPLPPALGTTYVKGSACSGPGAALPPAASPFTNGPASPAVDYASVQSRCETFNSTRGTALGMANWTTSNFLANTRNSWNFNPLDPAETNPPPFPRPAVPELLFNGATDTTFITRGIVGRCRIDSNANRVSALLACDELIIDPRATPLEINGTIMAGRTNIDETALFSGIRWRSLRHSQAVHDMRTILPLLSTQNYTACGVALLMPEFSPAASIADMSTQQKCNPLYYAQSVDAFNWSTVDPDCGINSGDSFVSCKRRPLRYMVREITRVSD
ncbi:MAG: hypothetical protein AB7N80_08650 [Bdellovibrionales bacterium]